MLFLCSLSSPHYDLLLLQHNHNIKIVHDIGKN